MKKISCPICLHKWDNIDASEDVCVKHLGWKVTVCETCGTPVFSDIAGFCPRHLMARLTDEAHATP